MCVTKMRVVFATLTLSAAAMACVPAPRLAADLIVTHAAVWTGNAAQPGASGLAVIGDRIVDVGTTDEIERWRGAGTLEVNAEGRRVVPGFNDAHVRLVSGGTALDNVDLSDAPTAAEFARRINERAKARPGEWIVGGNWDERRWTPASLPDRSLIDDITNSTPVFVTRYDGRMGLANAAALGRAGITEATPDPPGGAIVRDARGFPTGVLADAAMDAVTRVIPKTTTEQRLHAVKRTLEYAASLGVTSMQDMSPAPEDLGVYADLANRGELTARVYAASAEAGWYDQAKLGIRRGFGSPWLRIGAVEGQRDGSPEVGDMRTRMMAADHAGLQLCIDAIGDGGPPQVLTLFDEIARANGGRDRRFRLERAGAVASIAADHLASLGSVASLQPARVSGADGLRGLIDHRVRIALGSGWPAGPLTPLLTIHAAVARQLSAAEALSAQTLGSAFAEFQDGEKGTLARGKLADLLVLSDDLLSVPAAQIKDVHVLTTIVGGRIVHQRKPDVR